MSWLKKRAGFPEPGPRETGGGSHKKLELIRNRYGNKWDLLILWRFRYIFFMLCMWLDSLQVYIKSKWSKIIMQFFWFCFCQGSLVIWFCLGFFSFSFRKRCIHSYPPWHFRPNKRIRAPTPCLRSSFSHFHQKCEVLALVCFLHLFYAFKMLILLKHKVAVSAATKWCNPSILFHSEVSALVSILNPPFITF